MLLTSSELGERPWIRCPAAARRAPLTPVHTRTNPYAPVGIDLRHPWAELAEIAATGGVQEFERKIARNDHPALALMGNGARKLRVPMQDLIDDRVRERMQVLRAIGHEFLVYSYDMPTDDARRILEQSRGLVSAVEVVLPWARIHGALPELACAPAPALRLSFQNLEHMRTPSSTVRSSVTSSIMAS